MRAEGYKLCRRKYTYIFLLACLGLLLGIVLLLKSAANPDAHVKAEGLIAWVTYFLSMGLYLSLAIVDIVFSDQYKFNTLKNEISYGLPRSRIYLGKLVMSILLTGVMGTLMVAFYGLLCVAFFPVGEGMAQTLSALGQALVYALPQYLAGIALFLLLEFNVASSTVATVLDVVIIAGIPGLLGMLSYALPADYVAVLTAIQRWFPSQLLELPNVAALDYGRSLLVGGVWFFGCTALGLWLFHKREIN